MPLGLDDEIRASVAEIPVPDIPTPAFVTPPALSEARVAILTTGGLHSAEDEAWAAGDQSFRVLRGETAELVLGHRSPNYDRLGFLQDPNVILPADRLDELAQDGTIGSVADQHISFQGGQGGNLSTITLDSGPAAAAVLKADDVDVVLITPVCPLCTRTGGVIAHAIEAAGIATVTISLVREVSERLAPPRSLFCRFPFGRPLGRPDDPAFQREVLLSAFGLLEERPAPVLRDFPIAVGAAEAPLSCSVGLAHDPSLPPEVDEATALRPAYERQRAASGRTNLGRVVDADELPDLVGSLIAFRDGADWEAVGLDPSTRSVAADVRSYYEEAALSLADGPQAAHAGEAWFFEQTLTGTLLRDVHARLKAESPDHRERWFYVVPRAYQSRDLPGREG
ncbi:MAG TPA: glycine/sarcosine/betaine reductase selenoprotein B family protein [Solirubrobacterales bacterium]